MSFKYDALGRTVGRTATGTDAGTETYVNAVALTG